MRKINRIMISAVSALLCLVLITATGLSGTFAKYTTTSEAAPESARVAKWGITVSDEGSGLSHVYETPTGITVVNSGDSSDAVVAPGTSGVLASVKVSGTPEVMYNIDVTAILKIGKDGETTTGYDSVNRYMRLSDGTVIGYLPIIYKMCRQVGDGKKEVIRYGIGTYPAEATDAVVLDTIEIGRSKELANGFNAGTFATDKHNQAPNTPVDIVYSIEWEWPYTVSSQTAYHQNTEKDTALGEALRKYKNDTTIGPKFNFSGTLAVTVTQSRGS